MDDDLEATLEKFRLSNPPGWDSEDLPALLRHLADKLDQLGGIKVERLIVSEQVDGDGLRRVAIDVEYRRYVPPPGVPDYAAPSDIPIRDAEGRIIGYRSRPSRRVATASARDVPDNSQ